MLRQTPERAYNYQHVCKMCVFLPIAYCSSYIGIQYSGWCKFSYLYNVFLFLYIDACLQYT